MSKVMKGPFSDLHLQKKIIEAINTSVIDPGQGRVHVREFDSESELGSQIL